MPPTARSREGKKKARTELGRRQTQANTPLITDQSAQEQAKTVINESSSSASSLLAPSASRQIEVKSTDAHRISVAGSYASNTLSRSLVSATLDRYLVQSSGSVKSLGSASSISSVRNSQSPSTVAQEKGKAQKRSKKRSAIAIGDSDTENKNQAAGIVSSESDGQKEVDSASDSQSEHIDLMESAAHNLPGGDIVRDLYKIREKEVLERKVLRSHKRSKSTSSAYDLAGSPSQAFLTIDNSHDSTPSDTLSQPSLIADKTKSNGTSKDRSKSPGPARAPVSALAVQLQTAKRIADQSHGLPSGNTRASNVVGENKSGSLPSPTLDIERMRAPNGFRRFFVLNKFFQRQQQANNGQNSTEVTVTGSSSIAVPRAPRLPADSFFDFLLGVSIYGRFAGGWLWDEDERRLGDHLDAVYEEDSHYANDEEEVDLREDLEHHPVKRGLYKSTSSVEDDGRETNDTRSPNGDPASNFKDREEDERTPLLTSSKLTPPDKRKRNITIATTPGTHASLYSQTGPHSPGFHGPDPGQGTASSRKVFLLLIKSFIGTGVLFLPAAFKDGGFSFSIVFLAIIAYLSMYGMLLLVKTNEVIPGSFGDIAEKTYGRGMRHLVHASITLSQLGFCMAYIVFVSENARSLIASLSNCRYALSNSSLIMMQLLLYIPAALVRKIRTFAFTALIANIFTFIGLFAVVSFDIKAIVDRGSFAAVRQFNPDSFALYIGTAVYTFEGVGLVIPIAQSMREPRKFPTVLSLTMLLTTALYILVASISYLAFGDNIKTIVLLNLPEKNPIVSTVHILYIAAIMFTWPLVLFPAVRIIESGMLPNYDGKRNPWHKWAKNAFRTVLVLFVGVGAYIGSDSLGKLVAIIGSFACIPLSFIYPTLFHLKVFGAQSLRTRVIDISLLIFGVVAMVYVTGVTAQSWISGNEHQGSSESVCVPHTPLSGPGNI